MAQHAGDIRKEGADVRCSARKATGALTLGSGRRETTTRKGAAEAAGDGGWGMLTERLTQARGNCSQTPTKVPSQKMQPFTTCQADDGVLKH